MISKTHIISFLWGFAEATFFFFVPDIWLTRIALKDRREAFLNILPAVAGALTGGAAMFFFGSAAVTQAETVLDAIPGISTALMEPVADALDTPHPLPGLLSGALMGVPYKIYAVYAGHLHLNFGLFLLASLIARGVRFAAVTGLAAGSSWMLRDRLSLKTMQIIHIVLWALFYLFYFYKMGL